mmetsp:Transcript_8390/g.25437  ORF Transcript_8390/g.25437 Transcript_8390/m.25437 type:complete len:137 (+) Transcript_8390:349-759(+)
MRRIGAGRSGVLSDVEQTRVKAACLMQLGRASHQLVRECHSALPMFAGSFEQPGPTIGQLATAWDRSSAPAGAGLGCVERGISALPDSAEACAILKGILCIVDEEIRRVLELLQRPGAPGSDREVPSGVPSSRSPE